jgi:hypothetical protein
VPNPDTRAGLYANAGTGGTVSVDKSYFQGNQIGVFARNNVFMAIRDSISTNNVAAGIMARPASGSADVTLDSMMVTFNGSGIVASNAGGNAVVRISNVTVTENTAGLAAGGGGQIQSFGNNNIAGNSSLNGPPTSTIQQQ